MTRASIFFARSFCEMDGLHRNSGLPELRSIMRRKSGKTRLAVSSPAMTPQFSACACEDDGSGAE
jgi:hypothetical protein